MFTALHALAQSATLMIVVAAEEDQLRVSITPTQLGDKAKPHALRPLSLLATPAELDADFAAALAIWQAPKRSLIEQAQAAAGESTDPNEGEAETTNPGAGPAPAKRPKATRPKKADAATTGQQEETSAEEPKAAQKPAPVVDELTLNLF